MQNTQTVGAVEPLDPALVRDQLDAVTSDIPPLATKTGALGTSAIIEVVAEGAIEQGEVVCSWHGAHFDLGTGQPTCPPASVEVNTYPVRVRGQDIEIEL